MTAYVVDLRLRDPAAAHAFALPYDLNFGPPEMVPWSGIADADALLVQDEQDVLSPGAWLAALLAIASVAVLAGGRMTEAPGGSGCSRRSARRRAWSPPR